MRRLPELSIADWRQETEGGRRPIKAIVREEEERIEAPYSSDRASLLSCGRGKKEPFSHPICDDERTIGFSLPEEEEERFQKSFCSRQKRASSFSLKAYPSFLSVSSGLCFWKGGDGRKESMNAST